MGKFLAEFRHMRIITIKNPAGKRDFDSLCDVFCLLFRIEGGNSECTENLDAEDDRDEFHNGPGGKDNG